jgi:transcriptional regulator with XRE-family HTH domain
LSEEKSDFRTVTAKRLKLLRNEKKNQMRKNGESKFTIDVLADILGVSRSYYTDWEQGTRKPNGQKLIELANLYNTTVDYILGNTDIREQNKIDLSDLEGKDIVYNGKPLTQEQREYVASLFESLLKPNNKR